MKLEIKCPHCGLLLEVSSEWSGKRMSCSSCRGQFVVPGAPGTGGGAPPMAPPPRRSGVMRQVSRGGAGRGRRRQEEDDGFRLEDPNVHRRRHHGDSKTVHVVIAIAAVALIIGIFIVYKSRGDQSMFTPVEEAPRVYTQNDADQVVSSSKTGEQNYRTAVRNIYYADASTREGAKTVKEMELRKSDYREYLYKEVLRLCDGIDPNIARSAAERFARDWEADELARLQREDPGGKGGGGDGSGGGDGGDGEAGDGSGGGSKPETGAAREDRKLDQTAAEEIDEFVAELELGDGVPESYEARAQWLSAELATLREEAAKEGVNLNGFAYRVARCEKLFAYFDSWAKPTERSKKSFRWAKTNIDILKDLRDQWRAWSTGRQRNWSKEALETSLKDIVRALAKAETIFAIE
jgi:hypothetical protein